MFSRIARARGAVGLRRIGVAAEALAFAIAVAILVKAAALIAAPIPAPPAPQSAPAQTGGAGDAIATAAGVNPFRIADNSRPAASAPLTESALNIVLYGTWRGAAGGAAVISADGGPQRKVALGEEIVAGVTLEEVQDEFVVISNNGAREAVAIVNRKVDVGAPAGTVESVGEEAPPTAATLRDASLEGAGAIAPIAASAMAPLAERPADTIAAAAADETD